MMFETSAYYGQPTAMPLPFAPQSGFGTASGQYGQPIWQQIGGPLAHPQLWGQLGGGGQLGNPLYQYGPLAGLATGGWPQFGSPFGGFGGQFARPPLLEACPAMIVTPAFAPHGLVGNPLGGLAATLGSRGIGNSAVPFQATPQLAYGG